MYFHGSSKYKNGKFNKNTSKNKLDNIKSIKILKHLFNNLQRRKQLEIIKYNKKNQNRLNISINDYDDYFKIELDIIPSLNKYSEFIHISENDNEELYHFYFNNSKEEIKRYYANFNDKEKIKVIIDFPVKSFHKLFYNCSGINSLYFKKFFRIDIINMSFMFYKCSSLIKLDLSNYNTDNVTDMSCMFMECSSLKELNLSKFNTNNVINMRAMFYKCSSLIKLNISNFNTTNVKDMSCMFCKCNSLEDLDLSNFNFDKVIYFDNMFSGCLNDLKLKIKARYKNIREEAFF